MVRARSFSGLSVNPKSIRSSTRRPHKPGLCIRASSSPNVSPYQSGWCGDAFQPSFLAVEVLSALIHKPHLYLCMSPLRTHQVPVGVGASVAVELPELAHLGDL